MAKACTKPARLVVKREKAGAKLPAIKITNPRDAIQAAKNLIGDLAYEVFLVMYVNSQNCVIGYEEFTEGGLSTVTVHSSSIIRDALLSGARAILTVHQHPSGSLTPSPDDLALWRRIRDQAEMMDVIVLDNFIITDDGYFSEAEA